MPQYPIYVPMLPEAAQACIGRVHPDGQEAFDILEREGFETNSYVDLFDGGPTLHGRTTNIRSIVQSRSVTARQSHVIDPRGRYLVSNDGLAGYRAIIADLDVSGEGPVALHPDMLAALGITEGERIRVVSL
jgi:arginine N-succinyltransferase